MRGLETERLIWAPSEQDSGEFGPDHLQQLRVEKVLTQAEGAPVTSAHAAQSGVAAEKTGTQNTSAQTGLNVVNRGIFEEGAC